MEPTVFLKLKDSWETGTIGQSATKGVSTAQGSKTEKTVKELATKIPATYSDSVRSFQASTEIPEGSVKNTLMFFQRLSNEAGGDKPSLSELKKALSITDPEFFKGPEESIAIVGDDEPVQHLEKKEQQEQIPSQIKEVKEKAKEEIKEEEQIPSNQVKEVNPNDKIEKAKVRRKKLKLSPVEKLTEPYFISLTKKENLKEQDIYQSLLKPGLLEEEFRRDFLLSGPGMDFVRTDRNKTPPLLIHVMYTLLRDLKDDSSEEGVKQKELILDFASKLVKNGIYKKESMEKLIKIAENQLTKREKALLNTESKTNIPKKLFLIRQLKASEFNLKRAEDLNYTIGIRPLGKHSSYTVEDPKAEIRSLVKGFSKIAKKTIKKKEKANFIKNLANDLTTISRNNWEMLHPSEFQREAWMKPQADQTSPNISYIAKVTNQMSGFIIDQILSPDDPKESARVYAACVLLTEQLIKNHDYQNATTVIAALNNSSISRMEKIFPKKAVKSIQNITPLVSNEKSFKKLRAEIQKQSGSYVPYIGMFLTDLTFINGNPDLTEKDKKINFEKMELLATTQRQIETAKNGLEIKTTLHYDLNKEALTGNFDEKIQYQKSLKLVPRKG